jgi:hypothetical protein
MTRAVSGHDSRYLMAAMTRRLSLSEGDQDSRIAEQRCGDAEPLAHPQRETLGPLSGHVGQPDDAFDSDAATGMMPAAQRVAGVLTSWRS